MKKVRDGYKMTELGLIPAEWEIKGLSDITSVITKGTTPTTYGYNFEDDGINFIKIESINDIDGTLLKDTFSKISEECHMKLCRSILEEGDILFAIAGATIGKCVIVKGDCLPANTNQALAIIRLNGNDDNKFIFHLLRGPIIQNKIDNLKTNTAQPNLNLKQIGEFRILLPTLKEQQKISAILSSVDEQIENNDKLIEKTKELKKGLMQRLLTKGIGHDRFKDTEIGRIPEDWEVKKLEELCEFLDEKRKPIKAEYRANMKGNIPYYGASGIIDWVNDYIFDDEIILLGEDGENIKSRNLPLAFKVIGKCWVNNHAHVLKVKDENSIDFMTYVLENKDYSSYVIGSAQPKLNQAQCRKFIIQVPAPNEQKQISLKLSSVDEQIDQYELKKEKLQELKKGLMQKLLTGRIRVKG